MLIKTAVVTLGATHEPIDPVRFLGNHSSGCQGLEIVKALLEAEVKVIAIYGFVNDEVTKEISILSNFYSNLKTVKAETAMEMLTASQKATAKNTDLFMGIAAVCDFRPKSVSKQKLKKEQLHGNYMLELVENPDILATIAQQSTRPKIVVGFAAETENLLTNAKAKLMDKQCDLIIANDVSANQVMNRKTNKVYILCQHSSDPTFLPEKNKTEIAKEIVQYLHNYANKLGAKSS